MDADRWRRVERVLDIALTREPSDWEAVLDQSCSGDPELRLEVEGLLRRVGIARQFLESPPAALAAAVIAESRTADAGRELGRRVGAYRLVREIGRGGMSRVFLAERADGQFTQQVALKLLRPGLDSDLDLARFRAERQILASLNHPHIARLLDGGVTDDGLPYLVLEHVDGQPIDAYCDQRQLTVERRVALFLTVAEATQYAHRSLVIHRDLKPSNIFVTADGGVKLLDFGLAKLLQGEAPLAPPTTRTGHRWMTPEYAAPEQVRGEPVSTLTDVYQLGAVLYQLLAGRLPFAEHGRSMYELEMAILQREPPPPSAVQPVSERRKGLRGDLDAIVLKALRKEPERRYASAAALAEDLQRHRDGRPVVARPDSAGYRLRKFVARNRSAAAAAALALLALLGATGFSLRQMREAERQRDEARAQRDRAVYEERRALAANGFMEALLQSVPPTGRPYTTLELLGRARELLERDFGAHPDFVARVMIDLATTYEAFDNNNERLALLRRASEAAETSNDAETIAYAECKTARSVAGRGEPGEALARFDRAVRALATVRGPATRARMQCLLARTRMVIAAGRRDSALVVARQAVVLAEAAGDTSSVDYVDALEAVGLQLQHLNHLADALVMHRRMAATLERIGRGSTLRMLLALSDQGHTLRNLGEMQTADSVLTEAARLARRIDPQFVPSLLSIMTGEVAIALDRNDSAVALLERGLAGARRLGDRAREQWALERLVSSLAGKGAIAQAKRRHAELAAVVPDQKALLDVHAARIAEAEGRAAEAHRIYMEALAQRGFPDSPDVPPWHRMVYAAARSALAKGDVVAADSLARHALRLERVLGQDEAKSCDIGLSLLVLARARLAQRDSAGARAALRRALAPLEHGVGPAHPRTREARLFADSLGVTGGGSASASS